MAVLVSVFPEQRLFCRYLCPINSYISLYSTTGRVMVRSRLRESTCGDMPGAILPYRQRQRMGMPIWTMRR